jgi:hypothetical protein
MVAKLRIFLEIHSGLRNFLKLKQEQTEAVVQKKNHRVNFC